MNLTDKALQWLMILRDRPKMIFTGASDLYSFKMYLQGYIHGLSHVLEINLTENIALWLKRKMNQPFSLFWADFLLFHYQHKSEAELKQILLQTLEDFFQENVKWYEKME